MTLTGDPWYTLADYWWYIIARLLTAGVEMTVTVRIEVGEAGAEALDAVKGCWGRWGCG
jgi:hypothetical protein